MQEHNYASNFYCKLMGWEASWNHAMEKVLTVIYCLIRIIWTLSSISNIVYISFFLSPLKNHITFFERFIV